MKVRPAYRSISCQICLGLSKNNQKIPTSKLTCHVHKKYDTPYLKHLNDIDKISSHCFTLCNQEVFAKRRSNL